MSTTTLITFRVRAPPVTRTLQLYGSWDNFTTSYSMSRDLQAGSDYWSGCFNFSNIICDGNPGDIMRSRSGGLKMGGTYWYYYKIDDETDFHNVCERATTNCPLMPGQLINVLHVPYALSGNRSRNPSTSSTSSERRTMNPEERFMNPRPVPAKPEVIRVSTSPTLNDFSGDKSALANVDSPSSTPNASKFFRLAKKASLDSYTTLNGSKAGGLRAAFRIRTARSQSPEESKRGQAGQQHRRAASSERRGESKNENSLDDRSRRPQRGLLLRSCSDDTVPTLSFEQHRRQQTNLRSTTRVEDLRPVANLNLASSAYRKLGTVQEVASAGNTPIHDSADEDELAKVDLEKRLPTLPSTPSSAYPASLIDDSPQRRFSMDLENLQSHFSATTIDTSSNVLSMSMNERSHFSAWTTTTDTSSIFVDNTIPLPKLQFMEDKSNHVSESPTTETFLTSSMSYSSMCSSISTTPSTSFIDTDAEFETAVLSARLRPDNKVPHYSLPEDEISSTTTLKAQLREPIRGRDGNPAFYQQDTMRPRRGQIVHSESMQRLLDELSYLGEMIQQ